MYITETGLNNITVSDDMINCEGKYKVFRMDRTSDGGGVCILCKNNQSYKLTSEQISPADKYQTLETVVIDISVGDDKIRLITIYRPNKYTVDGVANASLLADLLTDVINVSYSCCNIGNFNLPKINWVDLTYPSDIVHVVIVNCFIKARFIQVVDFSTRDDDILDLIFASDTLLFSQISCHALFSNSDHNCISCSLVCNARSSYLINFNPESSLQFVYRDADWAAVDSFLNKVNWSLLIHGTVSNDECVGRYFVK